MGNLKMQGEMTLLQILKKDVTNSGRFQNPFECLLATAVKRQFGVDYACEYYSGVDVETTPNRTEKFNHVRFTAKEEQAIRTFAEDITDPDFLVGTVELFSEI